MFILFVILSVSLNAFVLVVVRAISSVLVFVTMIEVPQIILFTMSRPSWSTIQLLHGNQHLLLVYEARVVSVNRTKDLLQRRLTASSIVSM